MATGSRIVVCFAMDPAAGTVSCADSGSNAYLNVADTAQGSGTSGVRVVMLTAPVTAALSSGSTIIVTLPTATAKAMTVAVFAGLDPSNATVQDGAARLNASALGPPTHAKSDQVVGVERLFVDAVGVEANANTVTEAAGWTTIPGIATTGGGSTANVWAGGAYRIYASSPSSVDYSPTYSSTAAWAAGMQAFKPAAAAPPLAPRPKVVSAAVRRASTY